MLSDFLGMYSLTLVLSESSDKIRWGIFFMSDILPVVPRVVHHTTFHARPRIFTYADLLLSK